MISISIDKVVQPKSKNLIFISAGDRETFATFSANILANDFDLAIFNYGSEVDHSLFSASKLFATGKGTKFNALREIYRRNKFFFYQYESIWVCDDDLIIEKGDCRLLPLLVNNFGLKVVSPSHSIKGKNSHAIMLPVQANIFFRYVNFVEMGWPIFKTKYLCEFLDKYDGSLDGWGIDWWYLNFFQANLRPVAGIIDSIVCRNPFESEKLGGGRELDKYLNNQSQLVQWEEAKNKFELNEWKMENLFSVYHCN